MSWTSCAIRAASRRRSVDLPAADCRLTRRLAPLAAVLALATAAVAAAPPPAPEFASAAVVSVDLRASQAGVEILRQGGNAADAAVATALALAVVHPQAGNLGGGFLALWRDAAGEVEAIDARETAPARAHARMFQDDSGRPVPSMSLTSSLAIGVPGTVPGLGLLHSRHGRLPWAATVRPALRLARRGSAVSPRLAFDLVRNRDKLGVDAGSAAIFLPRGKPLTAGTWLKQPQLASTLQHLARHGPAGFSQGRLARLLADDLERRGAWITAADLGAYRPLVRAPLTGDYRGFRIWTVPPPSGGGLALIQGFSLLSRFDISSADAGTARLIHLVTGALAPTFADRLRWLGDPAFVPVPWDELFEPSRARRHADELDAGQMPGDWPADQEPPPPAVRIIDNETTHFSVVDSDGNAVALTTTLNALFGTGFTAAGTGVIWNNEMDDFASAPGQPNLYGLPGSAANAVAPGKRPLSSMAPMMVERDGLLFYVLGSPGGSTIPSSLLQVTVGLIDLGLPPQEAVNMSRVHHQGRPSRLEYEDLPDDVRAALEARGHALYQRTSSQGDVHLLARLPGRGWSAAADPRRGGAPAGY